MNNLAWLLAMRNEKLPEALALIELVIRKQGPIGVILDTRATILMRMQQPGKALIDLKQAVEESPTAEKYLHLAQAYLALRNQSAAVEAMQQAQDAGLSFKKLHRLEHPGCQSALTATGVTLKE